MKVYVERNNLQLESIRYRKNVDYEATGSMQYRASIGHQNLHRQCQPIREIPADLCSCQAYQNVSNTDQFDHSHFWMILGAL